MVYEPRPAEGTPLDSAIQELSYYTKNPSYSQAARMTIQFAVGELEEIREKVETIAHHRTVRYLFDLYFRYQPVGEEVPTAAHILRVVGDDLAVHLGYDFDEAWRDYHDALNAFHRSH